MSAEPADLAVTVVKLSFRTLSIRPNFGGQREIISASRRGWSLGLYFACGLHSDSRSECTESACYELSSRFICTSGERKLRAGSRRVSYARLFSDCENADYARPWFPSRGIRLERAAGCNAQSPFLATAIWWRPTNHRHNHAIEWAGLYRDWHHADDVRCPLRR